MREDKTSNIDAIFSAVKGYDEFMELLQSNFYIALLGAGETGSYVHKILGKRACCFIDETSEKQSSSFCGLPVLSPSDAYAVYGKNLAVVVAVFTANHNFLHTKNKLGLKYGWRIYTFAQALLGSQKSFEYFYLGSQDNFVLDRDSYHKLYNNLADSRSKEVLAEYLQARLHGLFCHKTDSRKDFGFLKFTDYSELSYIDCGAFDGDTVNDFIETTNGNFKKIYALEPDSKNYEKLTNSIRGLPHDLSSRVELINAALWYSDQGVSFEEKNSVGSSVSHNGNSITATKTLNNFSDVCSPILIKLDVEGVEWETLVCAIDFIRAKRPVISVSVYHRPNDLIDIFTFLNDLGMDFKFYLRSYGGDGADLMLFCVPSPTESHTCHEDINSKASDLDISSLSFDDFRLLAQNKKISRHLKVGFPDNYREGKEEVIFLDILRKMPSLSMKKSKVVEIGPGCSLLPIMMSSNCRNFHQSLIYIDSAEMLSLLPSAPFIKKLPGRFPDVYAEMSDYKNKVGSIIVYSVVQYVFTGGNLWEFLDKAISLLSDGGELLLADIPNVSMRKRFFASSNGIAYHQQYTGTKEIPFVDFNKVEDGFMDDSVVFSILLRARAQGCHAWVLPQGPELPMANRREDILIRKP